MKNHIPTNVRLFFSLAVLLAAPAASADTLTWDANGAAAGQTDGGGTWSIPGQWWNGLSNVPWTTGSDAVFGNGGTGGSVSIPPSVTTVNSLTFNSFGGTYALAGTSSPVTLNNGITKNAGAGTVMINSPVTLGGAQNWTNNSFLPLEINRAVDLTDGGFLLTIGGTGPTIVRGVINGTGGLTANGSNSLVLTGPNTFSGQLAVSGGFLSINLINNASADGPLGNSANSVILENSGTLSYSSGSSTTSTKQFTMAGGDGKFLVNGTTITLTLDGKIDGGGNLVKSGAGTLALSADNTYGGSTTVATGKLLVNNSNGSGTGTGTVSVYSGATLGGTGAISGAVHVSGILSPGASIETLVSGALTLDDGSTFAYEVDSGVATVAGADLMRVDGDLTLTGAVTLTLNDLASSQIAFPVDTVFSLVNYTGTWNGGEFTFDGNLLDPNEEFTAGLNTWKISYDDTTGGGNFSGEYVAGKFVNLTAVPEPGAVLLGSLGPLALLRRRR